VVTVSPVASDSGAPAEVATPTPGPTTASVSPEPTATYSGPILSSEGLGPLRVREAVPAGQDLVTWNPEACFPGDDFGQWQTDRTYIAGDGESYAPFEVWNRGEKSNIITLILVFDPAIETRHGLHVGSSLAEVKALGAVDAGHDEYGGESEAWVIRGSVGELVAWFRQGEDQVAYFVVEERDAETPFYYWEGICE
jgi:hypothetical protein